VNLIWKIAELALNNKHSLNNISVVVAVSLIGGGNWSTLRKSLAMALFCSMNTDEGYSRNLSCALILSNLL
jgi:hypothetical protein